MSDKSVPREQVVADLTLRFVSQFLRTKNKDYAKIHSVVDRVIPIDHQISEKLYLREGVSVGLHNQIYSALANYYLYR
jgi:hypothetical protein